MATTTRIAILGGGYAGVAACHSLEKHFRKNPSVQITLIDKNIFHTLMTELHEVAGGRVEPESVQVSYRKIFGGRRIELVTDCIERVDFGAKKLVSKTKEYGYDYLVIGAGAESEFYGVPGVKEHGFTLWSFDDAIRLRHHVEECFRRASSESDSARRKSLLRFVVAGAGFTGIELAGELMEQRLVLCKKYCIDPSESEVIVVEAMPTILSMLEDKLRDKVEAYLVKAGIHVLKNAPIVAFEPGIVKLKDGSSIETDCFVWTCGIRASSFVGALALEKGNKADRVLVDECMRAKGHPEVYVVGDDGYFKEGDKALPQVVETAEQTATTAARNIIASIEGGEAEAFKSNYHGLMLSVGSRYGVSNAGGIHLSGFFAIAVKHLINLYYLFRIAGVNQCWEYLRHEFLEVKDRRSILRGLVSYRIRSYWVLPLRLWLGFFWVVQAINKICEGWFDFSDGTSRSYFLFNKGTVQAGANPDTLPRAWVDSALSSPIPSANPTDAVAAVSNVVASPTPSPIADAVAAVSNVVASPTPSPIADAVAAVSNVVASPTPSSIADAVAAVSGAASPAPSVAPAIYFTWLDDKASIIPPDSPFATWFRHVFMDGIFAYIPFQLMQVMVVSVEMAIGLAIFGGFFTWAASAVSIAMCFLFMFTGMFSWYQVWFIFAGFLMLGGAGRSFGLDHWNVPLWKKWWGGRKFAKKHHLYTGEPTK